VYALGALVTVAAGPLHSQNPARKARVEDPNAPVVIKAEEIKGRPDRELELERNVELTKGATRVHADTACYDAVEDQVSARGRVNMWRFGDRYKGDALQLNLDSGKGWVLHPEYRMELNNAQGKANRIDFLSEDQALVVAGTYSTCEGPDPDWYLRPTPCASTAGATSARPARRWSISRACRSSAPRRCRSRCRARAAPAGCRRCPASARRAASN
jgi:LPS-assembly protein